MTLFVNKVCYTLPILSIHSSEKANCCSFLLPTFVSFISISKIFRKRSCFLPSVIEHYKKIKIPGEAAPQNVGYKKVRADFAERQALLYVEKQEYKKE